MRASPFSMAIIYFLIGVFLVYFATQNVSLAGWNIWTILIIAFAAIDFMIAGRFFRAHLRLKK